MLAEKLSVRLPKSQTCCRQPNLSATKLDVRRGPNSRTLKKEKKRKPVAVRCLSAVASRGCQVCFHSSRGARLICLHRASFALALRGAFRVLLKGSSPLYFENEALPLAKLSSLLARDDSVNLK